MSFKDDFNKAAEKLSKQIGEVTQSIAGACLKEVDKLPPKPGHPDSPYSEGPFMSSHEVLLNGRQQVSQISVRGKKLDITAKDRLVISNERAYAFRVLETGWNWTEPIPDWGVETGDPVYPPKRTTGTDRLIAKAHAAPHQTYDRAVYNVKTSGQARSIIEKHNNKPEIDI